MTGHLDNSYCAAVLLRDIILRFVYRPTLLMYYSYESHYLGVIILFPHPKEFCTVRNDRRQDSTPDTYFGQTFPICREQLVVNFCIETF